MGNAAILSPHLSDRATLTVDSEVSTLPGTHLQTQEAWQLYRATANAAKIIWDFGATVSINAGAIMGLNSLADAQWRWRYAANLAGLASPTTIVNWTVIDASGPPDAALFPNRRSFVKFGSTILCGALQVEISDTSNASPVQAWRAMAGLLLQPVTNIDLGLGRPIDSADVQEPRFGGGRATGARGRARGASFQWSALSRAEADALQDIGSLRGNWGDVLFLLDPAAPTRLERDSVLGPFASNYPDIDDIDQFDSGGGQPSRAAVRAFHGAALAHGGRDDGPPGIREYGPDYCAAFVLAPDGNRIEAVARRPEE